MELSINLIISGVEETVDLSEVNNKPLDESFYTKGLNEFSFTLFLPQEMRLFLKC
jgi:hypothetical protein